MNAEQNRQYLAGELYLVVPMEAMAVVEGQPAPTCEVLYDSLEVATAVARDYTMSAPWARHAQVRWVDADGWHRSWWMRHPQTREIYDYEPF